MNKRAIGITIIVLAGVLLSFIVYIIFFKKFNQAPADNTVPTQQETKTEAQLPKIESQQPVTKTIIKTPTKEEMSRDELRRLAMLFAARFGSFSNHSTYQNITDLKMFMTSSMQAWADRYVEEQSKKNDGSAIYFGITTTAVTAEVKSFDPSAGTAEIEVGTQRRESAGSTSNSTTYGQTLKMKFAKEGGAWRVSEARWDDQKLR